jgi:hypothetical protein
MVQLDEPAAVQSDPTVLELLLRNISRKTDLKPMTGRCRAPRTCGSAPVLCDGGRLAHVMGWDGMGWAVLCCAVLCCAVLCHGMWWVSAVRNIEHADKNPKKITSWIQNIQDVHLKKPPPTVHYSKNMPDVEKLMQIWPSEFEDALKAVPHFALCFFIWLDPTHTLSHYSTDTTAQR